MSSSQDSSFVQANVNGTLCDPRQPAISPLDRGFLYGDAVYEVCRSYGGSLFGWNEHWERLQATAKGIGFELPFESDEALYEIERTIRAWRDESGSDADVYARLQISRGSGAIGLDTRLAEKATYAIFIREQSNLSLEDLDHGMRLHVAKNLIRNPIEALSPALKTGNYLNNILGLKEAKEAGADDVLFLNASGKFCETSTRNIWFVFRDRIVTPPLSDGLLAGVTRKFVLDRFPEFEGLRVGEESLGPEQLDDVEEVFLTSSTQDVQPVASIDDHKYALGPDTVTRRLKSTVRTRILSTS